MNKENILQRILSFLKVNSIWTVIGTITGILGVPAAIWAVVDHNKAPGIGISVAGFEIPVNNPCNIYYMIPEEYYNGPMNGAVVFNMYNSGTSQLNNVYAMFEAQSIYETEPVVIFSNGSSKTVEQQKLISRRFTHQEYIDEIAGEQISVSYNGMSETLKFVCRNLPDGMVKCVQPHFTINRNYADSIESLVKDKGMGDIKGGRVYDIFYMNISYAATDVPAQTINRIPIIVTQDVTIDDIVRYYENEGTISSSAVFSPVDVENKYMLSILIYPKYVVWDNTINVSVEDADVFLVKYDTSFKERRQRKISVINLKDLQTESHTFKDSPERKANIKKFYDYVSRNLK